MPLHHAKPHRTRSQQKTRTWRVLRIRHYGLLAPAAKATRLALARQALSVPPPDPVIKATVEDFLQRVGHAEWARCPHCHEGRFVPRAAIPPLRQPTPQSESVRGPP